MATASIAYEGKRRAKKLSYDHYGLPIYEVDGKEYAVGSQGQADRAAARYISDSLWAFNANFLTRYTKLTEGAIKAIQEKMYEDANEPIRQLVGSRLRALIKDAIAADGIGHFLSPYDGNEIDSSSVPGLPKGKLAFRLN